MASWFDNLFGSKVLEPRTVDPISAWIASQGSSKSDPKFQDRVPSSPFDFSPTPPIPGFTSGALPKPDKPVDLGGDVPFPPFKPPELGGASDGLGGELPKLNRWIEALTGTPSGSAAAAANTITGNGGNDWKAYLSDVLVRGGVFVVGALFVLGGLAAFVLTSKTAEPVRRVARKLV